MLNATHMAENSQNVVEAPSPLSMGRDNSAMTRLVAKMTKMDRLVTFARALSGEISEIIRNPSMPGLTA